MHKKRRVHRTLLLVLILSPVLYIALHPLLNGDPRPLTGYDTLHFQKNRYLFKKTALHIRRNGRFLPTQTQLSPGYIKTDSRFTHPVQPNFLRLAKRPRYWIPEAYTSAASQLGRGRNLPIGSERVDRWYAVGPEYSPDDLVKIPMRYCRIRQVSLRREAARAFLALARDAKRQGVNIYAFSGFRPFATQRLLYLRRITIGRRQKQRAVARPGHSEHQLGTTVDVVGDQTHLAATIAFGNTRAARWLRTNCYHHGFVLSYGPDNRVPTGYIVETWHIRYIGKKNIAAWKSKHLR